MGTKESEYTLEFIEQSQLLEEEETMTQAQRTLVKATKNIKLAKGKIKCQPVKLLLK